MAAAATVTYNWDITWVNANPDGATTRPVIGINGQWPCPTINVDVGDRLVVNVNNKLGNETTGIHFHGLYQQGTAQMDGSVGVAQCAIPPGSQFMYDFEINQTGTYWYHAHNKGQYPDGLRGPLVVHDPASPYKDQYDEEIVLTLSDWYYQQMPSQIKSYLSNSENPTGGMPTPNATLLNDSQNIKFDFQPGKTYMVRIISMAAFTTHLVHFDQHMMKIVEVDGVYTEPAVADSLAVTSAQRYSVLIQAQNNTSQNFAFSSTMAPQQFDSPPAGVQVTVYGTLVYDAQKPMPLPSNATQLPQFNVTDDFGLVPVDHKPLLGPVDHQITLNANLVTMNGSNRAVFNNVTYLEQKVPSLYTALSVGSDAQNPAVYGVNSNAFVLKQNEIVEIVVNNLHAGAHPFHLHGHEVQVVARSAADAGTYNGDSTNFPSVPMRRDTVAAFGNGYLVLRFKADTPDKCPTYPDRSLTRKLTDHARVWLFHCHVEWHVESGLSATFVEAPDVLQQTLTIPSDHLRVCQQNGVPTQGNAAGNTDNHLDLTGANTAIPANPSGAVVSQSSSSSYGRTLRPRRRAQL